MYSYPEALRAIPPPCCDEREGVLEGVGRCSNMEWRALLKRWPLGQQVDRNVSFFPGLCSLSVRCFLFRFFACLLPASLRSTLSRSIPLTAAMYARASAKSNSIKFLLGVAARRYQLVDGETAEETEAES